MIDKIKEKIREILKEIFPAKVEKKVYRYYVKRLSPEELEKLPDYVRLQIQALSNELSEWRGKVLAQQEEIKRLREKLAEYEKLKEIEEYKEAKRLKEALESWKRANQFYIVFRTEKPIIPLSYNGKFLWAPVDKDRSIVEPVGPIKGIILEDDPSAGPRIDLVCETQFSRSLVKIPLGYLQNLFYYLTSIEDLVTQLKMGKILLNLTPDGKYVPKYIEYQVAEEKPKEESKSNPGEDPDPPEQEPQIFILEKYKPIFEQYPEIKNVIIALYNEKNKLVSEVEDLKGQLEELRSQIIGLQAANAAKDKQREVDRAMVTRAIAELGESYKILNNLMYANLQLQQRLLPLEGAYEEAVMNLEEAKRKYVRELYAEMDSTKKELADDIARKITEEIQKRVPPEVRRIVEEAAEKEEKKK